MSTVNHYHVFHHFEIGGKKVGQEDHTHVVAADSLFATLNTAIGTTAAKKYPGATLVIDGVKNIGPSATQ